MELVKKSPKVMSVKQQCADRALSTAATSGDGCGSQGLCVLPWVVVLEETVVFHSPPGMHWRGRLHGAVGSPGPGGSDETPQCTAGE